MKKYPQNYIFAFYFIFIMAFQSAFALTIDQMHVTYSNEKTIIDFTDSNGNRRTLTPATALGSDQLLWDENEGTGIQVSMNSSGIVSFNMVNTSGVIVQTYIFEKSGIIISKDAALSTYQFYLQTPTGNKPFALNILPSGPKVGTVGLSNIQYFFIQANDTSGAIQYTTMLNDTAYTAAFVDPIQGTPIGTQPMSLRINSSQNGPNYSFDTPTGGRFYFYGGVGVTDMGRFEASHSEPNFFKLSRLQFNFLTDGTGRVNYRDVNNYLYDVQLKSNGKDQTRVFSDAGVAGSTRVVMTAPGKLTLVDSYKNTQNVLVTATYTLEKSSLIIASTGGVFAYYWQRAIVPPQLFVPNDIQTEDANPIKVGILSDSTGRFVFITTDTISNKVVYLASLDSIGKIATFFNDSTGAVLGKTVIGGTAASYYFATPNNCQFVFSVSIGQAANGSFSCAPPIAPPAAVLVSPADQSSILADSIALIWIVSQSMPLRYHLQFGADSSFSTTIRSDTALTDTTTVIRSLTKGSTYWWRVRAFNAAGWGAWSDPRSFHMINDVTLIIPREFSFRYSEISAKCGLLNLGLPKEMRVACRMFSLSGRVASDVVDKTFPAGFHTIDLGVNGLSKGAYILRITAGEKTLWKRMAIMH